MVKRFIVLISAGALVAVCAACIVSILPTAGMTFEQFRVLVIFLIVLLSLVAVVLTFRFK